MLPAGYGDCLWIEYGEDQTRPHRVLIDGGTPASFGALSARLKRLPEKSRQFELFVITHIDSDHIGGALPLLDRRAELSVQFDDVWFNGYIHIQPGFDDVLGPVQGEKLTKHIVDQKLAWNAAFKNRGVVVSDRGALPTKVLPGGLKLTLLSPTWQELE